MSLSEKVVKWTVPMSLKILDTWSSFGSLLSVTDGVGQN